MTDLEKFIDTYKQIGVELKPIERKNKIIIVLDDEKFHGYAGFYSELEFTKKGKFLNQGFYE